MQIDSLIHMLFLAERDMCKTYEDNQQNRELASKILKLEKQIRKKIGEDSELAELFEEYDDMYTDYVGETEIQAYKHGFKSGFKFSGELNNSCAL